MNKVINLLKGKKTYIIGGITLILGFLQGFGFFTVPDSVYAILLAMTGISLRAGVSKIAKDVKPK